MKCVSKDQDLQIFMLKLNIYIFMSNFQPLEVVSCYELEVVFLDSKTQLQVSENSDKLT